MLMSDPYPVEGKSLWRLVVRFTDSLTQYRERLLPFSSVLSFSSSLSVPFVFFTRTCLFLVVVLDPLNHSSWSFKTCSAVLSHLSQQQEMVSLMCMTWRKQVKRKDHFSFLLFSTTYFISAVLFSCMSFILLSILFILSFGFFFLVILYKSNTQSFSIVFQSCVIITPVSGNSFWNSLVFATPVVDSQTNKFYQEFYDSILFFYFSLYRYSILNWIPQEDGNNSFHIHF